MLLYLLACDRPKDPAPSVDTGDADTDTDTDTVDPATVDDDEDGYTDEGGDCDDGSVAVNPGGHPDIPGDGVDTNCDGHDGCADLDCDGAADLVFFSRDGVYVYPQVAGTYNDADRVVLPATYADHGLVRDLNGDGFVDVAVANLADDDRYTQSRVYWGSAAGLDESAYTELATTGPDHLTAGDLDGDGWIDLAFTGNEGLGGADTTPVTVYWGGADGYDAGRSTEVAIEAAVSLAAADFDGDGVEDLAGCTYRGGINSEVVQVFLGRASRVPEPAFQADARGCYVVTTADVDVDGDMDLLATSYVNGASFSTASTVYTWDGGFTADNARSFSNRGSLDVAIGDFDGDGRPDVAWPGYDGTASPNTAPSVVYYAAVDGGGVSTTLGGNYTIGLAAADLDNDGYDDLVAANYDEPRAYTTTSTAWYGGPDGLSEADRVSFATRGVYKVRARDLNADGWIDLVFGHYWNTESGPASTQIYWGSSAGFSAPTELDVSFVWWRAEVAG